MTCSTPSGLSRAAVVFVAMLALFTSVCIAVPAAGSSAILPRAYCAPDRTYVVSPNETCQTISQNQSVSTNDIIALNCLQSDGTDLKANSTIRLPGCCETYTVKQGDNCTSIASSARNLTLTQFYAYNPALNKTCSNLLTGYNVCLTAPHGTPVNLPSCAAQNSASSTSAGTPSPSLAPSTDPACLPLYTVKNGDNCDIIASKYKTTTAQIIKTNPSVNSDCTNLVPGRNYCVSPS